MYKAYQDKQGLVVLRHAVVGPWSLNAYALIDRRSGHSVLVDPGAEPQALAGLLEDSRPVCIVVTHGHADHVGALEHMRRQLQVPVLAHAGGVQADQLLVDGDTVALGSHRLRVFHTPGHTADQISLTVDGGFHYLVGDTIFEGGPGHTATPADFQRTLETLRGVVLTWPDDALCHPGHGSWFRLGDKRGAIEAFLSTDHGAFCGDATWEMT